MKALFLAYFFACLNYKKRLPKLVRQSLFAVTIFQPGQPAANLCRIECIADKKTRNAVIVIGYHSAR